MMAQNKVNDEIAFEEWVKTVPQRVRSDPLWESVYYRLASYLYDMVWLDCDMLRKDFRGREIVQQIIRSSGSISANLEEAYGRGVGSADYVRIVRIALGEARETMGWCFRSRNALPDDLIERRMYLISQIIAMLVTTITRQRQNIAKA